jgi:hypothetical protein
LKIKEEETRLIFHEHDDDDDDDDDKEEFIRIMSAKQQFWCSKRKMI